MRQTEHEYRKLFPSAGNDPRSRSEDKQAKGSMNGGHGWKGNNLLKDVITTGWRPTCEVRLRRARPLSSLIHSQAAAPLALLPTALGRDAILIELNPEYAAMAEQRIAGENPLFCKVEVKDGSVVLSLQKAF